jgi:hypothetical protein
VRARLLAASIGLSACSAKQAFHWEPPASSGTPAAACRPAEAELVEAFATGMRLEADRVAALFPDLELQTGWVAHVELTSHTVRECGRFLLLEDPLLRFAANRRDWLDVVLVTDVGVHPRNILTIRRDGLHAPPPTGAWLAVDRHTLRHVGPVVVGATTPD